MIRRICCEYTARNKRVVLLGSETLDLFPEGLQYCPANISSPPMHWHPRTPIRTKRNMARLREAALGSSVSAAVRKDAEKVSSYWTSANSLRQVHRFTDTRQPPLYQNPLPDGSNISLHSGYDHHSTLYEDWRYRRTLVRLLHLPGIWFSGDNPRERFNALGDLYGFGRCLLELELKRCPPINDESRGLIDDFELSHDFDHYYLFLWIKRSRDIIDPIVEEVAELAYTKRKTLGEQFFKKRKVADNPTDEEILAQNFAPDQLAGTLDAMVKVGHLMCRLQEPCLQICRSMKS